MLWRRFNAVKDLEEIIKHMDFIGEKRVGSYNHPFYGKRFPWVIPDKRYRRNPL